ncbi:MAG: TIR domain-containing protein, partial [Methylobacterium organophilum]|nr:TIR domain-containing protein [Methylobacterium organophilum]
MASTSLNRPVPEAPVGLRVIPAGLGVPDVFLSYNREDQAAARRFAEAFAAQGLDVWWDTALKAGEAYDEVTETA